MQVGIHGVGIYLPEEVRKNDWWPTSVVENWRSKPDGSVRSRRENTDPVTPGVMAVLEGMAKVKDDPFRGAKERRVAPEEMLSSDMETHAARDALARAGIPREEIGLVLVNSQVPDYLTVATAAIIHRNLGLPEKCLSMNTESACNSFLHQVAMAEPMIRGGAIRYALLVQSSALRRIIPVEEPHSAWFGDGAAAVVLGPVSEGRGIVGQSHRTDGALSAALVSGTRGSRWYKRGIDRVHSYVEDFNAARSMLLRVPDMGKQVIDEALAQAGCQREQVDFFASHQPNAWFRPVSQEFAGLGHARTLDTFPWAGSLSGANVPFVLGMAEREGLLRAGDLVAAYTGGSGVVWSSILLRWGR